jgi:beta-carotene 3-hydroxylase
MMSILFYILVLLGTFVLMEAVTWATHKYVMHGFLWYLHRDHHQVEPGFFEKNDAFFVIFAVPSMLLIYFGTFKDVWWMQAIGFGIMAYGFAYFLVHDVIIHQRFKWFSRSKSTYVRAIRWAHKMHHKHLDKHEGESFGMLYVHRKYWEKVLRDKKLMAGKKVAYAPETDQSAELPERWPLLFKSFLIFSLSCHSSLLILYSVHSTIILSPGPVLPGSACCCT